MKIKPLLYYKCHGGEVMANGVETFLQYQAGNLPAKIMFANLALAQTCTKNCEFCFLKLRARKPALSVLSNANIERSLRLVNKELPNFLLINELADSGENKIIFNQTKSYIERLDKRITPVVTSKLIHNLIEWGLPKNTIIYPSFTIDHGLERLTRGFESCEEERLHGLQMAVDAGYKVGIRLLVLDRADVETGAIKELYDKAKTIAGNSMAFPTIASVVRTTKHVRDYTRAEKLIRERKLVPDGVHGYTHPKEVYMAYFKLFENNSEVLFDRIQKINRLKNSEKPLDKQFKMLSRLCPILFTNKARSAYPGNGSCKGHSSRGQICTSLLKADKKLLRKSEELLLENKGGKQPIYIDNRLKLVRYAIAGISNIKNKE